MHGLGVLSLWLLAGATAPALPTPVPAPVPSEPQPSSPTPDVPPEGPAVPDGPIPDDAPPPSGPPSLPPNPGEPAPSDGPTAPVSSEREQGGTGPLAIALEWNAPVTCPQGERVRTVVTTLLAREVELDPAARVIVRGDVAPLGSRWLLQLAIDDRGSIEQRRLEADTCESLADAAALILATRIDPRRVAATLAEQPKTPRGADRPRAGARTAEPPRKLRVALGVASGPALGLTPGVAAWLQGDVTLLIKRARVGIQAGHAFQRNSGEGVGATVRNTSATVRGCFAPTQRKISLPVCGLFELGETSADARGVEPRGERMRQLWIAAGLGAGFEYAPVPRVAIVAQVDALVGIKRPRFHVAVDGEQQEVFRTAPAAVRLVLGVSVRLP